MVLGERVAGTVCVWLVVEQLPILATDALKFGVVHDLAVGCLRNNVVVHEFYSALRSQSQLVIKRNGTYRQRWERLLLRILPSFK